MDIITNNIGIILFIRVLLGELIFIRDGLYINKNRTNNKYNNIEFLKSIFIL